MSQKQQKRLRALANQYHPLHVLAHQALHALERGDVDTAKASLAQALGKPMDRAALSSLDLFIPRVRFLMRDTGYEGALVFLTADAKRARIFGDKRVCNWLRERYQLNDRDQTTVEFDDQMPIAEPEIPLDSPVPDVPEPRLS